jgi:hypothetical protein
MSGGCPDLATSACRSDFEDGNTSAAIMLHTEQTSSLSCDAHGAEDTNRLLNP